jgi:L-rhamnose isomerase
MLQFGPSTPLQIRNVMTSKSYSLARETYAALGVDTEAALRKLRATPISLHCWQGDDVGGFERPDATLSGGGIQATGNYPAKARTIDQLRQDLEKAYSLLPGKHRLNLHAIYGDFGGKTVDRDEIEVRHFQSWIDWCGRMGLGLDFNPTCFSHPLAGDGFTLSHPDRAIRQFWIDHCVASRRIGAAIGRQLGKPCVTNFWIPDAFKDTPFDRRSPRERLEVALDAVFAQELNPRHNLDAVESKLFGIGAESYTVGSHEFYLGYAVKHQTLLYCLDAGHFHPTELVADKLSSLLQSGQMDRIHLGLDYFDASINRVAAWVIGTRATQKALLAALLEPAKRLRAAERAGDHSLRLALFEEARALPLGAVWNEFCLREGVPLGLAFLDEIKAYEREVLATR